MSAAAPAFCRDCLSQQAAEGTRRCQSCGSPRLVVHPERDELAIAHIDCDAFYAAVEKRDDPSLRDKPLIIGGGKRGVVSTCCYIARTFGVRSAMPMFKALALCPDAVVRKPDMAHYVEVGRQVRAMMLDLTPLVEPISIDEAFLDLTGTNRLHGAPPAFTLARLARRIESEIGISVSVGLSYCKFLAKIASDIDKPRGFAIIGREEARAFLSSRPVGLIWGVGAVAQERLAREGFRTIGDIQAMSETDFMRKLGGEGQRLWRLASGLDERRVSPDRETKSVSNETTFDDDVADPQKLTRVLLALSEKVSERLKAQGIGGETVTLKLKTADFKLRTRARTLPEPTQLSGRIFEAARALLEKEADGTRFRLIGVGVSSLHEEGDADRGDLADPDIAREKATETAIDALRNRFGRNAIVRGLLFNPQRDK
ncbi:MAG: DNA polymerase IV [Beijerinckiaceae bacterium]|nr:DNA polymerase IV [Beijerinckiaceae bacterium]